MRRTSISWASVSTRFPPLSPHRCKWVRACGNEVIGVRHEPSLVAQPGLHDGGERLSLIGSWGEIAVEPTHRQFVVLPDPDAVGACELECAVSDLDERCGVVHDACTTAIGARHVVVRKAERVPHFVCRELSHAGERHLDRCSAFTDLSEVFEARRGAQCAAVQRSRVVGEGADHSFPHQVVLPESQAPEIHVPFDDLTRARVRDRSAVGPAARRSMGPVDHAVADVHRVRAFRKHFHAKGVDETGRLESLVPPPRAVEKCFSDRLRHAAVEVVQDRLHRPGSCGARVAFQKPMPRRPPYGQTFIDGYRVVVELGPEDADARIRFAWLEVVVRELHQRMMLAERHRFTTRRDRADERSRIVACEGQ